MFDSDRHYFDDFKNAELLRRIAQRCYLPANQLMLEQIRKYNGAFRVAYSISGVLLEQFEQHAPDVLASFRKLSGTGCVEFLCETYHHSLAYIYSPGEFRQQVDLQRTRIKHLFGENPRVFRNTELIYNNELAGVVADMGFAGCLAEGVDSILGERSPNVLYKPADGTNIKLLLKNYRLSDDIAFRFSDHTWAQYPLSATKFAEWVAQIDGHGEVCNLFMDYETIGEHQSAQTGIFEFLRELPAALLTRPGTQFLTPSQLIEQHEAKDTLDVPHITSWADSERDLSAWMGNAMQSNALHELYKLEEPLKKRGDPGLLDDWRKLGCSDHFYYMCTKYWADGQIHKYFSPYESPYDSYINFMNVLDNIQTRVRQ